MQSDTAISPICFSALSFLLFYDYSLTFFEEVELLWFGVKNSIFYLSLLSRFLPMILSIIIFAAFHDTGWTGKVCLPFTVLHWLPLPLLLIPGEVALIIRLRSLIPFHSAPAARRGISLASKTLRAFILPKVWMTTLLVFPLLGQAITALYAMTKSLPSNADALETYTSCVTKVSFKHSVVFAAILMTYDILLFLQTLALSMRGEAEFKGLPSERLLSVIRRDASALVAVSLTCTTAWVLLEVFGRPDFKCMLIYPSIFLRSILLHRVILSLRRATRETKGSYWASEDGLNLERLSFEEPMSFQPGPIRTNVSIELRDMHDELNGNASPR
ncbi:hypothetical protein BDV98DRAFT_137699 [Pterulicium gracile]|uniref:Transmembrane protein n=1 Tax=Pterulicium gracile TaxID=1884261 RepID=A0A5C3QVP2_9AGAR|nr:hypothetical protein BDV98DRAFT_137699 [Pterula gracilis]